MRAAVQKWKRGLPWIMLACLIVSCAMALYTYRYEADVYRAVYTLYALPEATEARQAPLESAGMLARDMHALTKTDAFRQTVLQRAQSDGKSYVSVSSVEGTHMLEVAVVGPDARLVANLANAIGREICYQAPTVLHARSVQEMEPAAVPQSPFGPRRLPKVLFAALGVFVVGSLLACLFGSGRRKLAFDDEEADAFRLGALPDLRREMMEYAKLCVKTKQHGMLLDHVDRLIRENVRKAVLSVRPCGDSGSVVLVSAQKQDPQTPAAAALLAGELAQQGFRVLLMDTDSERSTVSRWLGVKARADFYDYFKGRAEMDDMIVRTSCPSLMFVDALHPEVTVADYAASRAFADFLDGARTHFDVIVLHARDMAHTSDAAMLSLLADTVVLTVANRSSTREEVEDTARTLASLGRAPHGVVFTGVKPDQFQDI